MMKKMLNLVIKFAVFIAMGGGTLVSCALEPSTEPPSEKTANHLAGLPFTIYEPQITSGGNALVFTYKIKADFPNWDVGSGSVYTAQKAAAALDAATPQSIEALILYYGTESIGLLKDSDDNAITSVYAGSAGTLTTKKTDVSTSLPHYVIVPLDTERIKLELSGKWGNKTFVVWIEENDAIGTIYPVNDPDNGVGSLGTGTHAVTGFNIGGGTFDTNGSVSISTIENFNTKSSPTGTQSISIATVLKEGETSKITFYTGDAAKGILDSLNINEVAGSFSAGSVSDLLSNTEYKPALRVDYKWAN